MNRIELYFHTDYDVGISRADYATAAYILTDCCRKIPSYSALTRHLANLYDAGLSSVTVHGNWNNRCTAIRGRILDNRYALDGENLEAEMCGLIADCLLDPLTENGVFAKDVTELMKTELIDTIDSAVNDKSTYAILNANKTVYVGEALELPASGTHEQAEKVTPESAYAAYRKMLETARIEIFAAGCSEFSDAERILTENLKKIPRGNICKLSAKHSPLKPQTAYVSDRLPMKQAIVRMAFKAPELTDWCAASMLTVILGGMTTSRFFENIREKQSLCYYCSSVFNRHRCVLTAYAGVEPKNIERVQKAILAELDGIRENGVTDEEITAALLDLDNQFSTMSDSADSLIVFYHGQLTDEKILNIEEYRERYHAVTSERIREAARLFSLDTVYTLSGEEE